MYCSYNKKAQWGIKTIEQSKEMHNVSLIWNKLSKYRKYKKQLKCNDYTTGVINTKKITRGGIIMVFVMSVVNILQIHTYVE